MSPSFAWLQEWYAARCDGKWEHEFGIKIESLDNPGWKVEVDLRGTPWEEMSGRREKRDESEGSWYECRIERGQFIGFSSPLRLEELLSVMRGWLESEPRSEG